ncbi:MAG: RNA methyltransferase [Ferruginibacter sp.]
MTAERTKRLTDVLDKRQISITVLLENVSDPHNISAVMRTCDAIGIQDIYILNNQLAKHKKWGVKSSSSASKWLTIHQYSDMYECFDELRKHYSKIYSTHLSSESVDLYEMDLTQSIALVFGNEHSGVSDEVNKLTDGNFIIPQVGLIKSLNISVACAVTLYEAYRQKSLAGHYQQVQLSSPQYGALEQKWGLIDL